MSNFVPCAESVLRSLPHEAHACFTSIALHEIFCEFFTYLYVQVIIKNNFLFLVQSWSREVYKCMYLTNSNLYIAQTNKFCSSCRVGRARCTTRSACTAWAACCSLLTAASCSVAPRTTTPGSGRPTRRRSLARYVLRRELLSSFSHVLIAHCIGRSALLH